MPRRDLKNIAGQRFGDRTAIQYVGGKQWLAECRCGLRFVVDGADLRRRMYQCDHDKGSLFWSKVAATEGCWLWAASKNEDGYGRFRSKTGLTAAHVFAWTEAYGPVPGGLELDHLCRNRACVRPDHLEAVTHAENVRRGALGRVTKARHATKKAQAA